MLPSIRGTKMGAGTKIGIIGIISVLVMSGIYVLTQGEIDHLYICTSTNYSGIFENLSSTNKTGYFYNTTTNQTQSKGCTGGYWEPYAIFSARTGLNISQLRPLESGEIMLSEYSITQQCITYNKTDIHPYVVSVAVNCAPENMTCTGFTNETRLFEYNYTDRQCVTMGVSTLDGDFVYQRADRNCWKSDDVFCCLDSKDGGSSVNYRGEQFKKVIRDGECGRCINMSASNQIVSQGDCTFNEVSFK